MLTVQRLREVLEYNPLTGIFTWKVRTSTRMRVGDSAGTNQKGYIGIKIDGGRYSAHRLAWLYVHGEWPTTDLDHKNQVKTDNRISNLRSATKMQNQQNQSQPNSSSKSGYRGVSYHRPRNNWTAQIRIDGKRHSLGYFGTPEQASEAYLAAKKNFHPFWRDSDV